MLEMRWLDERYVVFVVFFSSGVTCNDVVVGLGNNGLHFYLIIK